MTAVEIAIPFDEAFGERLARLRKTRGYTQTELGELLGLNPVEAEPSPRSTRPWRKLREIEKLPVGDRKAVLKILDGLVVRQKLQQGGRR